MKYEILSNGDLKISLQEGEREELFDGRHPNDDQQPNFDSDWFMRAVFEGLICNTELEWSRPEYIGALTDAPILAIYGEERPLDPGEKSIFHHIASSWEDKDGILRTWTCDPVKAWGFMNYCLRSPQEDLFNDGFVIFESGGVPEEKEFAHAEDADL